MKTYSKLLLFGEHVVIKGAAALAIPFPQFSGFWEFNSNFTESHKVLTQFYDYLAKLPITETTKFRLNLTAFKKDLEKGLTFTSSIPMGYGLGSSGALCAAVFQRYVTEKVPETPLKKEEITALKLFFSQLESFFHGSSSGVDPLICHLNQPLHITETKDFKLTTLPQFPKLSNSTCFLVDTGIARSTSPFVNTFLKKCESSIFLENCLQVLGKNTAIAIQSYLDNRFFSLFETISIISEYQLESLPELIPTNFMEIWKKGLDSTHFKLKLCGAGGGGFLLGFSKDWEKTQIALKNQRLVVVNYF